MVHPGVPQMVVLTTHGNAYLAGEDVPSLKDNVQLSRADIEFHEVSAGANRQELNIIAENPNEWFEVIKAKGATGIRFAELSVSRDWDSFCREGELQVTKSDGKVDIYILKYEMIARPGRAIKHKSLFSLVETRVDSGSPFHNVPLDTLRQQLREAIVNMRDFTAEHAEEFEQGFADAISKLDDPNRVQLGRFERGYWLPDQLNPTAQGLILASFNSWGYGGMTSISDRSFPSGVLALYSTYSQRHQRLIEKAVKAAASSSHAEANQ